ncbi:MAG: twin transmembrane helix small protein [Acetobacterales bacterium]
MTGSIFVSILLVLALLGTVGSLFLGLVGFVRHGSTDPERSNRLMRWRVMMQAAAIGLFALWLMTS